jgi:hypothetical protein
MLTAARYQHWRPDNHHELAHHVQATVVTMMMLRSVHHQPGSILMMMPNELMFQIFFFLPLVL